MIKLGTNSIGKIYLGSNSIGKAYLGSNLVFQKGGGPSGPGVYDYVQNGLVLHMDGKFGKSGSTWSSVVGNYSFTNNGATFNQDHVYFDGVDDYLINTSFTPPESGTGTIEVVYDCENFKVSSCVIFAGKTTSGLCYYISSAGNAYWSIGATSRDTPALSNALASVSINSPRKYENGVQLSASGSNYLGGKDNNNYIGRRSSGNYFKGKLYAIRIYNRKITLEEMQENLAIDNERFNLGLTL